MDGQTGKQYRRVSLHFHCKDLGTLMHNGSSGMLSYSTYSSAHLVCKNTTLALVSYNGQLVFLAGSAEGNGVIVS